MTVDWPWYTCIASEPLDQGDIITGCLVPTAIMPTAIDSGSFNVELAPITAIVMTATCDLAQKKVSAIVVCGVWSIQDVVLKNQALLNAATETCKRNNWPGPEDAAFNARLPEIITKTGKLKEFFNPIIKGEKASYIMLNKDVGMDFPMSLVSFENVYTVPLAYIESIVAQRPKRLRLRPPYREYASQAFGRFFTRVGLDIDIPRF